MTATIVIINKKTKHPDADSLYVYEVSNNLDVSEAQVVANSTNIYEVGDSAVYIKPDSVLLEDDMKITKRKLRGVMSYGMLAGPSTMKVGTDVTGHWCKVEEEPREVPRTNLKHQKWPSIEAFANVRRTINKLQQLGTESEYMNCTYAGKVKLHGTNAGVQIAPNGEVVAQKRSSVIYPDQDNAGFATWVDENKSYFENLATKAGVLTLHGEWCGPKIQKGVALSELDEKVFAIFAVQIGELHDGTAKYYVEPSLINSWVGPGPWYILPWHHEVEIDFNDGLSVAKAANEIETNVLEVEAKDPWVYSNFGKEGIGEGLVYFPKVGNVVPVDKFKDYIFKAKGYKHQVKSNKTPNIVALDIEKVKSVQEFANMFVTRARLLQGVKEACNDSYDTKLIGVFLQWMAADIMKESVAELEESELTWKDVSKKVMTTAREWYQQEICHSV